MVQTFQNSGRANQVTQCLFVGTPSIFWNMYDFYKNLLWNWNMHITMIFFKWMKHTGQRTMTHHTTNTTMPHRIGCLCKCTTNWHMWDHFFICQQCPTTVWLGSFSSWLTTPQHKVPVHCPRPSLSQWEIWTSHTSHSFYMCVCVCIIVGSQVFHSLWSEAG